MNTYLAMGRHARRSDSTRPDDLETTPRHRPLPGGWQAQKPIAQAVADYRIAKQLYDDELAAWRKLDGQRQAAQAADLEATGAALVAGKPDPGAKHAAQIAEQTADGERRLRALHRATSDAARAVNQAFATHREQWRDAAREQRAASEQQLDELLADALELVAQIDAHTLTIRRLHPNATPGEAGTRYSHRPEPHIATGDPRHALEALRDWLTRPYLNEDRAGPGVPPVVARQAA